MDEKDKKIGQLRNLLGNAKNKIQELKAGLASKDKDIADLKANYEKKIKDLQVESGQIIRQYEERLLRYQKSLQDSDNLVNKYQAQALTNSRSNEQTSQALTAIGNITMRIFTLNKVKDNSEAVQQLFNIEKCKQFLQQLQKIEKNQDLTPAFKSISKLTDLMSQALSKKRQSRLIFMKKQAQLKKSLDDEQEHNSRQARKILQLESELRKTQAEWKSKVDEISKSKLKVTEQVAQIQFIKQLMLKIFIGPKQAAIMALEVLSKVLKMSPDQVKVCSKKIK